jgi:hypothetical protein
MGNTIRVIFVPDKIDPFDVFFSIEFVQLLDKYIEHHFVDIS